MMKLVTFVALLAVVYGQEDTCPSFQDWRSWTDECIWFPLSNIRSSVIDACDIKVDTSGMPEMPVIPNMPEKCGHCSFKFRCQKRAESDGCFPINGEKEVCSEHGDVCHMPPFPVYNLGCKYELAPHYLRQCHSRPDISDVKREGMMKLTGMMPEFHCSENDGHCHCCCHPFMPSEDGSSCVQHEMPECEAFSAWNDWSEKCMWLPVSDLQKDLSEHCDFEMKPGAKGGDFLKKLKLPDSFNLDQRCGMCSFKLKCRKRDVKSLAGKKECFPLDIQKKACGAEDCETCATPCALPKLAEDCNLMDKVRTMIGPGIRSRMKKVPHSMRMGMMKMLSNMPNGKCIEKDDKCHCCCHPYEPTQEGECVLKDVCKNAEDMGIEVDMNLPADDNAFWFL
jgi:hypothetical protein